MINVIVTVKCQSISLFDGKNVKMFITCVKNVTKSHLKSNVKNPFNSPF